MNNISHGDSVTDTSRTDTIHAILIPGFWLGGWAWEDVEPRLQAAGVQTHPVTLPGLDGSSTNGLTLGHHVEAVVDLASRLDGSVVLVGHSGGALVVQGAIDRLPERFRRVIYVDSGPLVAGTALRPGSVGDIALPSWDQLEAEHSSLDGISDAGLQEFRRRAVDQPGGVARSLVELNDDRRFGVSASVICTSIPSQALQVMIADGLIPSELLRVRDVRYVDLPTGHWPMFSRPAELAQALAAEILQPAPA